MTIQLNTDNNLSVHDAYGSKLEGLLTEKLSRFSDYITRLEVHLTDENNSKEGINDKRCLLEARLEGKQPIAVSGLANTYDQAVSSAIDKLTSSLDTIIGKARSGHRS